jgi:hypothetical protein
MSYPQIAIHRGDLLHDLNFKGEGMLIAVLDAGGQILIIWII